MNFSKLNTDVLRQLLKLSEKKETLVQELEKIEEEILSHLHGSTAITSSKIKKFSTTTAAAGKKRAQRGMIKQNVLRALTEAGSAGLKVPELSQKINATSASIHVWLSNVGKKLTEIEKVGAGHFRIRQ
ncbi:MAG: hypothetical protein WCO92_05795 [Verrucomicrobiota bacterium]